MKLNERLQLELQEEQKAQEAVTQQQPKIEYKPILYDPEASFLQQYLHSAANQSMHFLSGVLGGKYVAQNSFSFSHKHKIVKYLFHKNNLLMEELTKKFKNRNSEEQLNELLMQ